MTSIKKSQRQSAPRPTAKRRGRPKGAERAPSPARAELLMQTALELFAAKELEQITIKDIAKASGFDAALIYYYFKDKDDLFDKAVRHAFAQALGNSQRRPDATDDPVRAIHDWFAHCRDMADKNRTLFRIMLHYSEKERGAERIAGPVSDFYSREEMDILANNITRGIDAGRFERVDAAHLAHFVSVHLDGITVASIVRKDFDTAAAFGDLERHLWLRLGHLPRARTRRRSAGS